MMSPIRCLESSTPPRCQFDIRSRSYKEKGRVGEIDPRLLENEKKISMEINVAARILILLLLAFFHTKHSPPKEEIYSLGWTIRKKGLGKGAREATVDFTTFFSAPREEYCASSCTFLEPSYIDPEKLT